jgi:iron complex outermembrane receptor protein
MNKNSFVWIMSLAAVAGTASAQESPPGQLDEVTVTAERRAENIHDVPSSVSTVSGEDLDVLSTGGQDVRLLAGRVPSLNVESSFGRAFPRFYIRGYGKRRFSPERFAARLAHLR